MLICATSIFRSIWLFFNSYVEYLRSFIYFFILLFAGAVVAQLASARLSEREVPGSIFSDFNICFDFPLIRVAIALNTRKTEHWQWQGG